MSITDIIEGLDFKWECNHEATTLDSATTAPLRLRTRSTAQAAADTAGAGDAIREEGMSIKITMLCTCDGCGVEIAMAEPKASEVNIARWRINDHLKKTGGVRREQMSRPTKHYCASCADGNPDKSK